MQQFRPDSLKLKLTFGAIIFGTLLLLAQSVIQFYSLRGEVAARIESEQFSFLATMAEHLEERIGNRLRALEAATPSIPIALLDHPAVLEQYLRSKTTLGTLFDDLFIFDASGILIVDWPAHPGRRGLNLADRDYITAVREKMQSAISQPLVGRASGQPMIILAAPVKDAGGKLRAIIGGVLNLNKPNLIGEVSKTKIGNSGYLYLVSAQGKFIAHPDQSRILQAIPQRGINHALDRAFYEGFEGTEEGVNSRGLQGLFTFKRLPSTGWILASVVPSSEAMRPIINVQRNMVGITLLLILFLMPVLWFLLARLMHPLGQLADEMRSRAAHMALGQAPTPIPLKGSGEIRTAGAAFNEFLEARNRAEAALLASEAARRIIMENLENAKIAAEAANEAKSRFLANMSHEIRTPMHGVIGMLDLALMNPLDDETRDYLRTARSSAESLLLILNGILDISRIEAGKLEIEQTPFSLPRLLQEAAALMHPSIVQKHLHLRLSLPEELPALTIGDPLRIRQVILNLLGNALKFTEQGEIHIAIDILDHTRQLLLVRITVNDTGIGIPADRLESIFQAFIQADGSTTRQFGGTGLGLTISRQLVELMGGEMEVRSRQGEGSSFSFTLPLGLPNTNPSLRNQQAA